METQLCNNCNSNWTYGEYDNDFDYEKYRKELDKKQQEHLEKVKRNTRGHRPCLHEGCSHCHGTGVKENGEMCIHMISCPCPKCNPYHL